MEYVYDQPEQPYQKFQDNIRKMELKKKGDLGYIIVGPSKNGKTCIFCALTGIPVKRSYNQDLDIYRLQPQIHSQLVNQSPVSTTQHPNVQVYSYMGKEVHIIDMPGHSDDRSFRKLCNFYYIREMALKLKKFRFLIVLNVTQDQYILSQNNLDMLKNFTEMFKSAQNHVTLCVNKAPTLDKAELLKAVKKQMQDKLDQKTFKYYSWVFQNQEFYLVPQARLMTNQYLQIPPQIIHLIRSDYYKQKSKNYKDQFGSLKFDSHDPKDLKTQNDSVIYCKKAYQYIKNLVQTLFELTGAFIDFFLNGKKVDYESIILKRKQKLKFNVEQDNNEVYSELKLRIKIQQENELKESPMNKRRSSSMHQDKSLQNTQKYNFNYLETLLNVLQGPITKTQDFKGEYKDNKLYYQEMANGLIQALRQISYRHQKDRVLKNGNIQFEYYLNSLSLINIRKWKQINFLCEAIQGSKQEMKKMVTYAQDYFNEGNNSISQRICQIIKIVYKIVQAQYDQDEIVKNDHTQLKQIIQLVLVFCKISSAALIEKVTKISMQKIEKGLLKKMAYFDVNPIKNLPQSNRKEILQKIQKSIQAFQNMRGSKLQNQHLISRQLEILAKIGDLFEKVFCYERAIEFHKIVHHNIKIKRCLDKIRQRNDSSSATFFIKWGDFFAEQLDFYSAYQYYQMAKQKTFKEQQLLQIHKRIISINNPQERQKLTQKINQRNLKDEKIYFSDEKLYEKLKKSKQQCKKYLSQKKFDDNNSKISRKQNRFKNYIDVSNIKGDINKFRNEFR